MAKLPDPPDVEALRRTGVRAKETRMLRTPSVAWRVHWTLGPHVLGWNQLRHYGPIATARFDPHTPPPREQRAGVLYLADDAPTALLEAFQTSRVIDRNTRAPYLTGLRLARTVRLLDLTGAWPTRAGASQAINSGRRDVARAWARAVHAAFGDIDGLSYPSSMRGQRTCVALWETAADALPAAPELSLPLSHPGLSAALADLADTYGYRLI